MIRGSCPGWITRDEEGAIEAFEAEAEAREALDSIVDRLREESRDGWHEGAERVGVWRCELVLCARLEVRGTAESDTPDGQRCRAAGWDFWAELVLVGVDTGSGVG